MAKFESDSTPGTHEKHMAILRLFGKGNIGWRRYSQILLTINLLTIFIGAITAIGILSHRLDSGKFREEYTKETRVALERLDEELKESDLPAREKREIKNSMKKALETVIDFRQIEVAVYVLLAVFSFIVVITFMACLGAILRNVVLLSIFTSFMIILLIVQIAAFVYVRVKAEDIMAEILQPLVDAVYVKKMTEDVETVVFVCSLMERMQVNFECCGIVKDKSDFRECHNPALLRNVARQLAGKERSHTIQRFVRNIQATLNDLRTCSYWKPRRFDEYEHKDEDKTSLGRKDTCSKVMWKKFIDEHGKTTNSSFGAAVGFQITLIFLAITVACSVNKKK